MANTLSYRFIWDQNSGAATYDESVTFGVQAGANFSRGQSSVSSRFSWDQAQATGPEPQTYEVSVSFGVSLNAFASVPALVGEIVPSGKQYLVEIDAFSGGAGSRFGGRPMFGAGVFGQMAFTQSMPVSGTSASYVVTLRYADRHWVGNPTDTLRPDTFYEGRVTLPLLVERQIPVEPDANPLIVRQFGAIELINSDAELDNIVHAYAVDGRAVRVYFGDYMAAFSEFSLVLNGLGVAWEAADDVARLLVRDRTYSLDKPLQVDTYAGTGGLEGGADVKGKVPPRCYGEVYNVRPVLVDAANNIWQVNDRAVQRISAVYDRGAALSHDTTVGTSGDVASYATLVNTTVAASSFATSHADGVFKLGSAAAGLITCDVEGDAENGYVDGIDEICLRIMQEDMSIPPANIDLSSWSELASGLGACGIYIDENSRPTAEQVISQLVAGATGWWGASRLGLLRAGRLIAPEDGVATFAFDQWNVVDLTPLPLSVPHFVIRIGYHRNWTVQGGEDLAGSAVVVTPERRQFLAQEYRAAVAIDTSVRIRHPQATDGGLLPSYFVDESVAQSLADDLLTLHKFQRKQFELIVKEIGHEFDLGQIVRVTWPRLGLGAGQNFVIVGIREDGSRLETILKLWG